VGIVDFILNLAALLLWLNWRAAPLDALGGAAPGTLAGTLRRAERKRLKRWHFPVAVGLLLGLRAVLYWMVGPLVNWTAQLDLGVVAISFRSDQFGRMAAFSFLSFGVTLAVFLLWLLLLSALDCGDPLRRFVRWQLGRLDGWPLWLRLALPFGVATTAWWALSWPLARWGITPPPLSGAQRLAQAALVGLESYLTWKFVLAGVLVLHLLDSYIYFGTHPFWNCVHALAKRLLRPLAGLPLRVARVDFAPLVGIVVVFLFANLVQNGMNLPPWAKAPAYDAAPPASAPGLERPARIPGLVDFYRRTT
jgi:uncharacterized protein YggT (Ycf19 family)